MTNLVMEYHYASGDIGAYPLQAIESLPMLVGRAFTRPISEDPLTHILIRAETTEEKANA